MFWCVLWWSIMRFYYWEHQTNIKKKNLFVRWIFNVEIRSLFRSSSCKGLIKYWIATVGSGHLWISTSRASLFLKKLVQKLVEIFLKKSSQHLRLRDASYNLNLTFQQCAFKSTKRVHSDNDIKLNPIIPIRVDSFIYFQVI